MITNFMEFECIFYKKDSVVDGEPEFEESIVCLDLMNVIAFNPYRTKGYTVARMTDANSYIIKIEYDDFKLMLGDLVAKFNN